MTKQFYKKQIEKELKRIKPFSHKLDYMQRDELRFAKEDLFKKDYDIADYQECLSNLKSIVQK
jgi:hypothetical protein